MEYGRYRILSQLGQGGMATVYLAEDPLLQRLVAIKVIQAHLSSNSGLMDRFTVEAKTIASLRHINIVEVFDFGIQDDQQFLVMEYIDGQNLQAVCGALQGRPMPNAVAAAIICQAAEGLTSAEKHGVVHRDIKPENLMFNSEGTLKIADFGIRISRTKVRARKRGPSWVPRISCRRNRSKACVPPTRPIFSPWAASSTTSSPASSRSPGPASR